MSVWSLASSLLQYSVIFIELNGGCFRGRGYKVIDRSRPPSCPYLGVISGFNYNFKLFSVFQLCESLLYIFGRERCLICITCGCKNQDGDGQNGQIQSFRTNVHRPMIDVTVTICVLCSTADGVVLPLDHILQQKK